MTVLLKATSLFLILSVRVRCEGFVLGLGDRVFGLKKFLTLKNFWELPMKIFWGLKKFLGFANENDLRLKKFLGFANENVLGLKKI